MASSSTNLEATCMAARQDLLKIQARVDRWMEKKKQGLEEIESHHERAMEECQARVSALTVEVEGLDTLTADKEQSLQGFESQVQELQQEIQSLRDKEGALPSKVGNLRCQLGMSQEMLDAKRKELEEMLQRRSDDINELTRGVMNYKHLGLEFEKGDNGCLCLIFTQVDPTDPSRPFLFSVKVDDDQKFDMVDCDPALDPRTMDSLLRELNLNPTNFSDFVKKMRREFKALAHSN